MKPPLTKDWFNSKLLDNIVKEVLKAKIPSYRRSEFRVSSLPFCPLISIIENKNEEEKFEEYESNFYFSIGHALHFLFQKFARDAKTVTLIGDWKCNRVLSTKYETEPPKETTTKCGQKYEFCSFKTVKKKHVCPHRSNSCNAFNFEYEEITISYNELTGHIDLLFKIEGEYHLIDIKQTSTYLFYYTDRALEQGWYPNIKYWHQVESYSVLVEKQKNIKIKTYGILYVSRENPGSKRKGNMLFVRKLNDKMRKDRLDLLEKQIANNKRAKEYIKSPSKEKLEKTWKNRPCQTKEDYEDIMDAKWYGKEKCPYFKDGSCFNGKIKKTINKLYEVKT